MSLKKWTPEFKAKFVEMFKANDFNISKACENMRVSRQTFYDAKEKDAEFAREVDEAREDMIDEVENALLKNAKEGNVTAQIFFLKTQAAHRGYTERSDIKVQQTHSFDPSKLSDEELSTYISLREKMAQKDAE